MRYLTEEEACEYLYFDPTSNCLRRKLTKKLASESNSSAEFYHKSSGYLHVKVGNCRFQAHRLVYLITKGPIPDGMDVDHIDRDRRNNAPYNLRLATKAENSLNRSKYKNNTSGFPGVRWFAKLSKWIAYISFGGKRFHLGVYTELQEAVDARKLAEVIFFGDFRPIHSK
jgi:hypothetical protein